MAQKRNGDILERGHIYFFYRPKMHGKTEEYKTPHAIKDIHRLDIILQPEKENSYRLLIVGQKHLPEAQTHEKLWMSIDLVTHKRTDILNAL